MLDIFAVLLSALFIIGVMLPVMVLYVLFVGVYVLVANPLKWVLDLVLHGIESEPMEIA